MGCEEFGARLVEARTLRKWSQPVLGEHLAERSTRLGRAVEPVPKHTISPWENGHRYPDAWYAYCLCDLLGSTPEALYLEEVLTPAAVGRIETFIRRRRAVDSAIGEAGRMGRTVGGCGVSGPAGQVADLERLSYVLLGLARMDAQAALDLRHVTDEKLDLRGQIGARLLLRELHTHLGTLQGVLHSAASREVRRELVLMAGETAAAAAQGWYSLFDYGEAQLMCDYTRRLAHELGGSTVTALGHMCEALLYTNRLHGEEEGLPGGPGRAIELLQEAEKAMGGSTNPYMALSLHALRSWEHAAAGDDLAAGHDLDAAQRAVSRWTGPPSGYFRPWDASYLLVARGKTALMLGKLRESTDMFERALASANGWMRPYYEVQTAAVCAQAGEPERAGSLLLATMDVAEATGSTMLLRRVRKLTQHELAPYGDLPIIRTLRDRLAAA